MGSSRSTALASTMAACHLKLSMKFCGSFHNIRWILAIVYSTSFHATEPGPQPFHSVRCSDHFCQRHFSQSSKIHDARMCILNTTFVLLFFVGTYSCTTAPQLLFYSQHWTRLTNSPTNTIARLELSKHGLQSFFEGDPYIIEQNFPWQRCRELFIMLCAQGPGSFAWNDVETIMSIK